MTNTTSEFDTWVRGCEINNTEIWPITKCSERGSGVYMTKSSYTDGRNTFYNRPMYHVWLHGELKSYTANLREATSMYERLAK